MTEISRTDSNRRRGNLDAPSCHTQSRVNCLFSHQSDLITNYSIRSVTIFQIYLPGVILLQELQVANSLLKNERVKTLVLKPK